MVCFNLQFGTKPKGIQITTVLPSKFKERCLQTKEKQNKPVKFYNYSKTQNTELWVAQQDQFK